MGHRLPPASLAPFGDQNEDLNFIGIDDFTFRRGQTYGTIVCDLERRRPVTLLPDRALDTSRTWLAKHPP